MTEFGVDFGDTIEIADSSNNFNEIIVILVFLNNITNLHKRLAKRQAKDVCLSHHFEVFH